MCLIGSTIERTCGDDDDTQDPLMVPEAQAAYRDVTF